MRCRRSSKWPDSAYVALSVVSSPFDTIRHRHVRAAPGLIPSSEVVTISRQPAAAARGAEQRRREHRASRERAGDRDQIGDAVSPLAEGGARVRGRSPSLGER